MNLSNEEIKSILTTCKNREASERLGVGLRSVNYWREKLGIRSPHSQAEAARKYTLNDSFFKTIDTQEKAYVLGFLAADGNVNPDKYGCEIRICLHQRDKDVLEKINNVWDSTYPVRIHRSTELSGFPGTNREQVKLSIRSSQFQIDLAKYGIIPNKTAVLRYPIIPDGMDRHFLRGFLDGDGHITNQEFGWVTNPNMANDLQKICMKHGFPELRRYRIKDSSDCVKGGPKFHHLIKWMFEDATICLQRKKERFDKFWSDRIYVPKTRSYTSTKHIPCALEALPPVPGSLP